jgi:hypothetical protein
VANWSGKLRKGGKQTSAWTLSINYEKCWNVWWGSAADNLLEGLNPYPDGWRSAKRRAFRTIQWRSTAAAFPMAVSGNAWLDRLRSLLADGHLEVAIDKQYQGPARIETMASKRRCVVRDCQEN